MNVHPIAALFPMMTDDELQTLAADIKTNGLLQPIIMHDEQLIDGRNRLAACKLAKIEPTFEPLGDRDPVALILSANVHRRHLSKGQQAMAYAQAYPDDAFKGGRGNKKVNNDYRPFSPQMVTWARFVLRHAPDLALQVMAGGALKDAYDFAVERKRQIEEMEQRIKERKLAMEAIGATMAITINADLSPIDTRNTNHGFPQLPSREAIEAQQVLLRTLMAAYQQFETLAEKDPLPPLADNVEFVNAIRSSIRRLIGSASKLADNYNKTLSAPSIKRVK